jgi:probable HAF family extracellular repeat protein
MKPFILTLSQWSQRGPGNTLLRFLLLFLGSLALETVQAQTRYKIIHIPTPDGFSSTALGLNNQGNVVGYSYQGDESKPFLYSYSNGTISDLGSLGGKAAAATAINHLNQVVGYSADGTGNVLAFVYAKDQGMNSLGTLPAGSNSEAFAINSSGQVVGDSQADGDSHRPVLFTENGVTDLGLSVKNSDTLKTAYGTNANGQVVGRFDTDSGSTHAFLFASQQLTDLGTLGGSDSEALGINQTGIIVGDSVTRNGATHAFVFSGGSMQDLGTLNEFPKASYARAINDGGQIVGESDGDNQKRAFVYSDGQMTDLTQAAVNLRQAGFAALDSADGINNQGWIIGFGTTSDGRLAAFLAIPVGVTADPPGGPDAPVFDSGDVAEQVWVGGGWFYPPTLWPPHWHHHHPHPWPTPPRPRPTPTPPWRTPPPPGTTPAPRHTPTPSPTPRSTPTRQPNPTPRPTPNPQSSPTPKPTPTPPQIQLRHHPTPDRPEKNHHGRPTPTPHIYDPHKGGAENTGRGSNQPTEHRLTPLGPSRSRSTPPRALKNDRGNQRERA